MSDWPKKWRAGTAGLTCPRCGERAGRPILRGMPTHEVFRAIDEGVIDIALGGCCIVPDDPTHECSECGHQFERRHG